MEMMGQGSLFQCVDLMSLFFPLASERTMNGDLHTGFLRQQCEKSCGPKVGSKKTLSAVEIPVLIKIVACDHAPRSMLRCGFIIKL